MCITLYSRLGGGGGGGLSAELFISFTLNYIDIFYIGGRFASYLFNSF